MLRLSFELERVELGSQNRGRNVCIGDVAIHKTGAGRSSSRRSHSGCGNGGYVRSKLKAMAVNPGGNSSEDFRKIVDADIIKFGKVVKAANLHFEQ